MQKWPDDAEYAAKYPDDAEYAVKGVPGRNESVSGPVDLCLGGGSDDEEGGATDGGGKSDKKSRNLDSVGRVRRSEAKLQSKIQIFETISHGGILPEDIAKCDPGQRTSKGGWN